MSTEGECELIRTLSFLKFPATGLPCGLSNLIGSKKKTHEFEVSPVLFCFFFDPTVEPKALFVPGPKSEVVILTYKLFQGSKRAVTNYLK